MQGIVFYPLLLLWCFSFLHMGKKYGVRNGNILILIPFITMIFLFGFAWPYLGKDKPTYLYMYTRQYALERIEPVFKFLNTYLYKLKAPHQIFMCANFVLQYLFLYLAIKESEIEIDFALFTFFLTTDLYLFNDGLRQAVGVLVIFYAYRYLYENKIKVFLLWGAVAFFCHKSSLLAIIPLFAISFLKSKLKYKWIYHILFLLLFFFFNRSQALCKTIIDFFIKITKIPFLYKLFINADNELGGTGLVMIARILACNMMLPKFLEYAQKDKRFCFYFRLYFLGICIFFICCFEINWKRLSYIFSICELFVIPYCLKRITKRQLKKFSLTTYMFLFGIFLLMAVFCVYTLQNYKGCTPYKMDLDFRFWQMPLKDLHFNPYGKYRK